MTKMPGLAVGTILMIGAIAFSYGHSENEMLPTHEEALSFFSSAWQNDIRTDQEILKVRTLVTNNYDKMTAGSISLESNCFEIESADFFSVSYKDPQFKNLMTSYCRKIETKVQNIETFKSKMAIYQNSLYYINSLSSAEDPTQKPLTPASSRSQITLHLLRTALAYANVSSPESKGRLEFYIEQARRAPASSGRDGDAASVRLHAENLVHSKEAVDQSVSAITSSDTRPMIREAKTLYMQHFQEKEHSAGSYRKFLFASCLVMVMMIVFALLRMGLMTKQLAHANSHLEERVRARTRELEESQALILQQQQTLVAAAKMSALGEMAGGVAHEINNPLTIIGMRVEQLTESLEEGNMDPVMFKSSLQTVARTTQRIAKIVSGLRFFARDGQREAFQSTSVQSLVEETMSFCREKFQNHGVMVSTCDDLNPSVAFECRSVEISQVLLNLLNNAFDAVQNLDEKWIRVSAQEHADTIQISVTDSGRGVPAEIQDKLMQPFFTTKEVGKGTGLGLSISRGIIEAHHGLLKIDNSSPNTCFTVILPKRQEAFLSRTA